MQTDLRVGRVVDDILNVIDEGVVDPDWFLNKGNKPVEKAIQGKVGVIMGETADFAFDSNPRSVQARSKESNPAADWVPFNPFGNQPLRTSVTPDYSFVFSNNAAGQNPEKLKRIVDILDWMAGEEGFLLTHYGMEGKHYTRKGNTITLMTDAIEKDVQERGDLFEIWSFFTPRTPEVLGLTVLDSRITERDKAVYRSLVSIPVREGLGTTLTPPLGIDVDAMRSRQNELQVKMLFSDKSGEYWPEYRQEIMDFYEGHQIFRQYEEKIRAARINR
jgi:putative aldouronate transport system substrate-binding protein